MAIADDTLWQIERRLWLEGAGAFEELIAQECLMVFAQGVMDRNMAKSGIEQAPRWDTIAMSSQHIARPGRNLVVLGYRADARRTGEAPYQAFCSSTYHDDHGDWRLVQHQQTVAN